MDNDSFASLMRGAKQAAAHARGEKTNVTIHSPVKMLREQLGLSQAAFAETYHIPVGTLRQWETGRRAPDATARAYLAVIAKNPDAVQKALAAA